MTRHLPAESEAAFQIKVTNYATFCGWMVYHPPPAVPVKLKSGRVRGAGADTAPGWPDLFMVHVAMRRLEIAELKGGKTSRRATIAEIATRPEWLQHSDVTATQASWLQSLGIVADAINGAMARDLEALEAGYGVGVHVWRPADWDHIEETLRWVRQ